MLFMAAMKKEESLKKSEIFDTNEYVKWAQESARNLKEYNHLLTIKNDHDRNLIVSNANLFFEIQNLLKTKSPYINELSFDELLDYIYTNRLYYEIWFEGYYFHGSNSENLPTDVDLKKFIRIHFDPNAKKLTGSNLDKVISWIKEGWCLDNIIETLKHYYDHRKMYQDSNVLIENLTCEDFLNLSKANNFAIFRTTYLLFSKLNESLRKEITHNSELYAHFIKLVHEYMKNQKNHFNLQLFEIALTKINLYKGRTFELITYLSNSILGFDFDAEKESIEEAVKTNDNLKIIATEVDYFIYQIFSYETLKTYSSPHWCIRRSREQYNNYVSKDDDFYVILQRYPRSQFDYKTGVTFTRKTNHIKHSFGYSDKQNEEVARQYAHLFKSDSFLKKLFNFKKKRKKDVTFETFENENEILIETLPPPVDLGAEMEEEVIASDERSTRETAMILPRF